MKQARILTKAEFFAFVEYRYKRGEIPVNKEYRQDQRDPKREKAYRMRKEQTYNLLRQINKNADHFSARTGDVAPLGNPVPQINI